MREKGIEETDILNIFAIQLVLLNSTSLIKVVSEETSRFNEGENEQLIVIWYLITFVT